jgi:hypothetical protein
MYAQLGLAGAYLAWTVLFVLLGGFSLGPLVAVRWPPPRFTLLFALAFAGYAAGWTGGYFLLRGTLGEWVGSFAGSLLLGAVLALGFGTARSVLPLGALLFVASSVGYFAGSEVNGAIGGWAGMLLWGGTYGLCLGMGLGAVLHLAQKRYLKLRSPTGGRPSSTGP